MSQQSPASVKQPLDRRTLWLLVKMHVPFIAFAVAQGGWGFALTPPIDHKAIASLLVIVASALQLRHSLATAAGVRPRYWRWTLALLLAICWVPLGFWGFRWVTLQWYVLASLAMLLPGRLAIVTSGLSALVFGVWYTNAVPPLLPAPGYKVWALSYIFALQLLAGVGLYGATRLIRFREELRAAHADLAELAIERERLRISRDLHDLLGQSLSAVSLKGDLAIGLLEREETARATAEIESLVSVARTALHDLLDIAHREPPIALSAEIERANDLFAATGTATRWDIGVDDLAPPIDELFAWALREGVTNVLRHSTATSCSIRIGRQESVVRLDIVNDGAMPSSIGGNGLSGLAARAATLSGVAMGYALGDGRYRLRVDVPEVLV
jgi:two-component system, NarL family, sensor histidine kinase DesK